MSLQERSTTTQMSLYLTSALAGIGFHYCYARRVEIDFSGWRLIGVFCLLCLSLVYYRVSVLSCTIDAAIQDMVLAATTFILSMSSSILLYRSLFHRLRHIPGPTLARLSSLYLVKKSCENDQFHLYLEKLHQRYGDVVRIGLSNLSLMLEEP
jgi:cytochrome P450 family 628